MEQKTPSMSDLTKYEQHFSESSLFDKIKKVAAKAGQAVIENALILYYTWCAPTTTFGQKAKIAGALGYFICPVDLVPDVIPVIGFADDAAALAMVIKLLSDAITPEIKRQAREKLSQWF